MEKIIELTPLNEMGKGNARVTDDSVEIEVSGIIGGMKAWLVGGEEAEKIGNLVEGKLYKKIDTTNHTGILITQSGRQIMIGRYREETQRKDSIVAPEDNFLEVEGLRLKKVTQKSYAHLCEELRYILSNKNVYESYKRHGHYRAGESEEWGALALKCDENEENPLAAFGDMCIYKNGYVIVCVDKKTKRIKKI